MTLDAFGPATRAWFTDAFPAATRVQREGWPAIVEGGHALLLAPTGSGKTLAAFLAALDRLTRLPADAPAGVRVLYVSPLKALVADIERNLRGPLVGIGHAAERLGAPIRPVRVDVRTGDTDARARRLQAREPADILVTTPESLYLLLGSAARETLRSVETVIVDEIHVLAGSKRGAHLALSLERLAALCPRDPQRVGLSATQRPLDRIARYLGGDRPVAIVDTSEPPRIDLRVLVPVDDMDRPEADGASVFSGGDGPFQRVGGRGPPSTNGQIRRTHGLWPAIYPELLALIRAHRSTIVFTNSRLLCERLTQRLNELAGEELVRAHHGSVSHARRAEVEEALKRGELPAIVATSSLELGVDMGAVDLVVLVESPGAVSSGLQRVGRAGHGVGQTSIGRLFPKHKGDLVECAVVAERMLAGEIEATHVPRNPLDVLAQQVVAMVAMDPWSVPELARVVRRASPYAELPDAQLTGVLDMLSGRYPSDAFAELAPRLVWDRATDALRPRRGSATLMRMNAGTIPDRGLYGVFLAGDGKRRLGELDEEMVYETRTGDLLILGASTWRVDEITRDRVLVTPAPGEPGRLPFWKGDRVGRPVELGRALGAFVREVAAMPARGANEALAARVPLDPRAVANLLAYIASQREATERVPSDRMLVVERFRDELGDWRVCVHSPFGIRVHAPWAMAVEAALSRDSGFDVQSLWTDDGISFRFLDAQTLPPVEALLPDPDALEDAVVEQLGRSALFAARFRENAARALLLPRRSFKGRSPLWQQRLRAQQLQAVATGYPAFPIVLETYRECLADVFDLPATRAVLTAVRSREIGVHEVETERPSPFARSMVFAAVAAYMYDGDAPLAERRAQALTLDRGMLRELLGEEELRELLDPVAVAEVERSLQRLDPEHPARDADMLHDLLRRLGDLTRGELASRADGDPEAWLTALEVERRAVRVRIAGEARWIAADDAGRFRDALGVALPGGLPEAFLDADERPLDALILRWARTHGPFAAQPLAARWGLPPGALVAALTALAERGALIRGAMRPGGSGEEWCDPDVMRRLRRRSLARLREEVEPVERAVYARFLAGWHGIGGGRSGPARLREALEQLEGLPIAVSVLESAVLPARVRGYDPRWLDELGMTGQIVWLGRGALGPRDGRIALFARARVGLLADPPEVPVDLLDPADPAGQLRARLLAALDARGACFLVELQVAGGADLTETTNALWDLVWAGLVTNDTFGPLRALGAKAARRRVEVAGGRWSRVDGLLGASPDPTARAHARATRLLERYGVATAAAAQAEGLPGGFSSVYPVLRAMEEAGKIRRGWFVDGLDGAQFALPGAIDRLRGCREPDGAAHVLAATDPAAPWGALAPWPRDEPALRRDAGARVVSVSGEPVLYVSRGGALIPFDAAPEALAAGVAALKAATRRTLRVTRIDGEPALTSPHRDALVRAGFAVDYTGLALG